METQRESLTSNDFIAYNMQTGTRKSSSNRMWVITIFLGVALFVAVAIAIGLAVGLGVERSRQTSPSSSADSQTCTSASCVDLSNQILENLDESFDPCDDFYKFACNKFDQEAIIPDGVGLIGRSGSPRAINVERMRTLMAPGKDMGIEAIGKAITYYQSCYKGDNLQSSVQTFRDWIQNTLGGWPLIGINSSVPWSINNQGHLLEQLYGSGTFFTLRTIPDPQNTTRTTLFVEQGGLTVPAAVIYQNPQLRSTLKQVLLQVFMLINPDDGTYSEAIDDILEFEAQIVEFYDFDARTRSVVDRFNFMTYEQLLSLMPQFNWPQNIQFIGSVANIVVNQSSPVVVVAPEFLRSMNDLIQQTDATTLENYSKWQLLYKLLPTMSSEFADIYYNFLQQFTGDSKPSRYKICVDNVEAQVPFAVARAFTEVYLPSGAKEKIAIILEELEIGLTQRMNSRSWLDDATRQRAIDKLNSISELVAFPDMILNDAYLNGYYSMLNVSMSNSYLQNDINSKIFNRIQGIRLTDANTANNRSLWYTSIPPPTTQNAVYFPFFNQIYIFEGILETPFFKVDWPFYFQFGTLGFVVGHEYTHGFDNNGRRTNEIGNIENWWTDASINQFNTRAQCFIDQYSRYSVPAGAVNGTLTLAENIADNGGIATAYVGYKNYIEKTGLVEKTLPALSYNTDQLFFIASAQLWCQVATLRKQSILLAVDVHSPNTIRPPGFVSNSPEFAAAFNCPLGSPMNPENKCELW